MDWYVVRSTYKNGPEDIVCSHWEEDQEATPRTHDPPGKPPPADLAQRIELPMRIRLAVTTEHERG